MWQHGIYNSPKSQPSLCSYLHSIMATSNAITNVPSQIASLVCNLTLFPKAACCVCVFGGFPPFFPLYSQPVRGHMAVAVKSDASPFQLSLDTFFFHGKTWRITQKFQGHAHGLSQEQVHQRFRHSSTREAVPPREKCWVTPSNHGLWDVTDFLRFFFSREKMCFTATLTETLWTEFGDSKRFDFWRFLNWNMKWAEQPLGRVSGLRRVATGQG